jgi:hypothetical protein
MKKLKFVCFVMAWAGYIKKNDTEFTAFGDYSCSDVPLEYEDS